MSTTSLNGVEAIEYQLNLIRVYNKGYYVKIRGNYVEIGNKDNVCITMEGNMSYQNAFMYLSGLLEGLMRAK